MRGEEDDQLWGGGGWGAAAEGTVTASAAPMTKEGEDGGPLPEGDRDVVSSLRPQWRRFVAERPARHRNKGTFPQYRPVPAIPTRSRNTDPFPQ